MKGARPLQVLIVILLLAAAALAGCGGDSAALPVTGTDEPVSDLALTFVEDTYIEGGSAEGFTLNKQVAGNELRVEIAVSGAVNLKALMFELDFDPAQYDPLAVEMTGALDPSGGEIIEQALALDKFPGYLAYGQLLPRPQDRDGFTGDAVLAVARFALAPDDAKATASVPVNRRSQGPLDWNSETNEMSWYYHLSGDFNQDGYVSVADVTPIGQYWRESSGGGPFPMSDRVSQVDYDSNGEINMADFAGIVRYLFTGVVFGYRIYGSTDAGDYPTTNDGPNGSGSVLLGTVELDDSTGGGPDRKHFTFTVEEPIAGAYYWVRLYDDEGNEGTPSTIAGGP